MNKKIRLFKVLVLIVITIFMLSSCAKNNNKENSININDIIDASLLGPYAPAHASPQPFKDSGAADFVSNIKLGWNLGNTLDAVPWDGFYRYTPNPTVEDYESLWVKHFTTQENIDALKNAGFNAIRIPVSWAKAADKDHVIRRDWMERVTEIVNYAAARDMYIILNTHHDESIFKFRDAETEASLQAFAKIWAQIASQFKNYNEKLIFEGLNEPRTKGSANEWTGGTVNERNNLNKHHQVFVDVVRSTGGNNDKRFLMISTYAASASLAAVSGLVLPNDKAENKLIVSVHAYSPYDFALNVRSPVNTWSIDNKDDVSAITEPIDRVYDLFIKNGVPAIMGEFGAINKNNDEVRGQWAEFYVGYAREKGMPCFLWDNGGFSGDGELFGLIYREDNEIEYPLYMEGLLRGAGLK